MKIIKTKFDGLKIIQGLRFLDNRGYFREIYKKNIFKNSNMVFWCMSKSKKNVIRGMHLQTNKTQEKFITVVKGKILDVVVDLRKKSNTYGKHFSIKIAHDSDFSLFIPQGFAHGFLCLSKTCLVYYKCTNYRDKKSEITLNWNDKDLNIKWPVKNPILSKKDRLGIALSDY